MKKLYFTLLAALIFSLPVLANNVIVKGTVTYSNGTPAANHSVYIQTDSLTSPAGCYLAGVVYTDASGHYADTLNCTGAIVKVKIQVPDCNGSILTETPQVNTATNMIERNFVLSCNQQQTCQANFSFGVQQLTASFASNSVASSGSMITTYYWSFGDGTLSTIQNPVHAYTAQGTYTVRLVITSSTGCTDSISKPVTVTSPAVVCHAQFFDSLVAPNKYYFFSGSSTASTGSTITQRIWSFGDGTGNTGNNINADHIYQQGGTYNVCLRIVTSSGCVDSVCKTITINIPPPPSCHADFAYIIQPGNTKAISIQNLSSGGTYPIQYIYNFGDGSTLTSNSTYNDHFYTVRGTYTMCLVMVSGNGCRDSICKTVIIPDSAVTCHANFSFQSTANGAVYFTNTSSTLGTSAQYYWTIGPSVSTAINPVYSFASAGTYNVCLRIYTNNCADSICKTITIAPPPPPTNCEAVWSFTGLQSNPGANGYTLQFGSPNSHATSAVGDSIRERIWAWGDGSTTTGNNVYPIHTYTAPNTYNVCLIIRSASGCSDTTCRSITVPMPNQVVCTSQFTYENLPVTSTTSREVRFNSTTSAATSGDSIISRKWTFGDGTTLTNNNAIVSHVYTQPGTYTVCLTIKSALGCEKTECKTVIVTHVTSACVPHFTWVRTGAKQVSFNSSTSWVPVNDTITERKWNFGDGSSILTGNVISPVHNYLYNGIYTVSLKIRTVKNCEQTFILPITVQDSTATPPTVEPIKIISIFPNPATIQIQTIVWSQNNNVQAELAIYDVYGIKKWSVNKVLLQGNNITVIPTALLMPGPYYFRVTTTHGVKSRPFFKRN